MQSYALTIDKFLDHAAKWSGDREIVTAESGQVVGRIGYAGLRARSNRLSGALAALGLNFGDRIATLAWNTQHHLELYYAAMGVGLVCHTLNPRLTAAHLAAMVNEAEDRAIAVSSSLAGLLAELLPLCPRLEHVILMDGDPAQPDDTASQGVRTWQYERLLETHGSRNSLGQIRRGNPRRALLHVGHHRQAQGRALHAPLQLPAHPARLAGRRDGTDRQRHVADRRADVPRQRMGPAFRCARRWGPSWCCRAAKRTARAWPR